MAFVRSCLCAVATALSVLLAGIAPAHAATTTLSDVPLFSASNVPANLMLALSVEFPTGNVPAYSDFMDYQDAKTYFGYFDSAKCYRYNKEQKYFEASAAATSDRRCMAGDTDWSGNVLNWATMTGLDIFRQALTGGNRVVDTPTLTVLQRSRQSSGSNIPLKWLYEVDSRVPRQLSSEVGSMFLRSIVGADGGDEIVVDSDRGVFLEVADNQQFNNLSRFYVRVKVCDTRISLESNCVKYPGGNYKPVGLIQQNADRIRVGAASYVLRDGYQKYNGTIRSTIHDVGPTRYNGLAPRTSNPSMEWDASTGVFLVNPDAASASASGVSSSGTINYLNKFGYASDYMHGDPTSEVYWAALAHLMQVPLPADYGPDADSPAQRDGFPTLATTAIDPVQYSCQGNSILVIGDSHTHCDSGVPGSGVDSAGINSICGNHAPLAVVNGADAGTYATALGKLPLIEANSGNSYEATAETYLSGDYRASLGSQAATTAAAAGTYGISGLAYFAHTQDIRPGEAVATKGKQTVDTYVVDVLESGPGDGASEATAHFDPLNLTEADHRPGPTQYWLAAKYGGFEDINDDGKPANYRTWHTNPSDGLNTVPDNWFPGRNPEAIQRAIKAIFERVASNAPLSASGAGSSISRLLSMQPEELGLYGLPSNTDATHSFALYSTSYRPRDWTGDVAGALATVGSDTRTQYWSARERLEALTQTSDGASFGWDTTRRIVTMGGNGSGAPFRYSQLSDAQRVALRGDSTLVDFLRGDRSNEGAKFHARRSPLGDIVGSDAVLVQAAQSPHFSETENPGYGAFRSAMAQRQPVVYVGANDGMLHAFDGKLTAPTASGFTTGGVELFAYVPSFVFDGPNGTPNVDGLAALSNISGAATDPFSHHFYVDQTPQVADVDFNRVAGNADGAGGTPDWHTLLVGALGKGGKGIYALDVTTVPPAPSLGTSTAQEAQIKQKVRWEFSQNDMGFFYGKPLIAKTRKYGWVVLVTSGYNNASGLGRLFVLNAKTGELLETLSTSVGSANDPSGLARPQAYTKSFADVTIEQVYAGDLKGNLWRFDLSAASGTYPAPVLLSQLKGPDGVVQPITTAPRIEIDSATDDPDATRRWVFVGTGRFLEIGDLTSTTRNSIYALRDGDRDRPACASAGDGSCAGLPLARGALVANANLLTGVTLDDASAGWYHDLTGQAGNGGATERVVVDPDTQAGQPVLAWTTLTPTNDPCNYEGAVYAVNYGTGKSVLQAPGSSGGGFIERYEPPSGMPTRAVISQNSDGTLSVLTSTLRGSPQPISLGVPRSPNPDRSRVNWREVAD